MPKRQALVPTLSSAPTKTLGFSDERWAKIKEPVHETLSTEADARLRAAVTECCSWFLTQNALVREGQETAAAMRNPGKRQLAPFKRLAKHLREAADAWKEVGKAINDDRLSDIREYDKLEVMAQDAERRIAGFQGLGNPRDVADPWPEFVCRVAQSLREAGLKPTVTGRVYDDAKPTWFQEFMVALNENLLGNQGRAHQLDYSRAAFYAEIAKAVSGYGRPGKARKQTT